MAKANSTAAKNSSEKIATVGGKEFHELLVTNEVTGDFDRVNLFSINAGVPCVDALEEVSLFLYETIELLDSVWRDDQQSGDNTDTRYLIAARTLTTAKAVVDALSPSAINHRRT